MKKTLFSFICLATMCASCGDSSTPQTANTNNEKTTEKAEEAAITVTAKQLVKDYEENEVNADNLYKSKKVIVSGNIETIAKDISDDAYVVLSTAGEDEFAATSVQCYFTDANTLATLKKGQTITVEGIVGGKMMNVLINEAKLK